jgi:hypothetical protein
MRAHEAKAFIDEQLIDTLAKRHDVIRQVVGMSF